MFDFEISVKVKKKKTGFDRSTVTEQNILSFAHSWFPLGGGSAAVLLAGFPVCSTDTTCLKS